MVLTVSLAACSSRPPVADPIRDAPQPVQAGGEAPGASTTRVELDWPGTRALGVEANPAGVLLLDLLEAKAADREPAEVSITEPFTLAISASGDPAPRPHHNRPLEQHTHNGRLRFLMELSRDPERDPNAAQAQTEAVVEIRVTQPQVVLAATEWGRSLLGGASDAVAPSLGDLTYRGTFRDGVYVEQLDWRLTPAGRATPLGRLLTTGELPASLLSRLPLEARWVHAQSLPAEALAEALAEAPVPGWLRERLLPSLSDAVLLIQGEEPGLAATAAVAELRDPEAFRGVMDGLAEPAGDQTLNRWFPELAGLAPVVVQRGTSASASLNWDLAELLVGANLRGGSSAQIGFNASDAVRPIPQPDQPELRDSVADLIRDHGVQRHAVRGVHASDPTFSLALTLQLASEGELPLPAGFKLPDTASITRGLPPTVAVMWADADGWHHRSRGAFPLAGLLAMLDLEQDRLRLGPLLDR